VCAGAAAASAANKNARRRYEFALQKRERKHRHKLNTYAAAKVQYSKALSNIHAGLGASYSRAQNKLNGMRAKALQQNQGQLMKLLQKSQYGNLLAAGRTGQSIARIGLMEKAALGRFYANKANNLTKASWRFDAGNKLARNRAKLAQEKQFAKVAFQPTADVAPPRPAMQDVGAALFGDALGLASTIAGFMP
tara:strand:- start:478 stop:1056 length:579 start_codon:yes stop_codon:yes gene_type:complete